MALMAAHGEITPMPTAAVFADTQGEPKAVYEWLKWLTAQLPYPVIVTSKGSLAKESIRIARSKKTKQLYMKGLIPAFVKNEEKIQMLWGEELQESIGLLGRKCTADYKVEVVAREVKKICGVKRGTKKVIAHIWIGISTDEFDRKKPSRKAYLKNIHPLLEKNMSRDDCLSWMKKYGYPEPPRSACLYCPFHSDKEWTRLKNGPQEEWDYIVEYERALQGAARKQEALKGIPYLHETCQPINEVVFDKADGRKFTNECEGMCGV